MVFIAGAVSLCSSRSRPATATTATSSTSSRPGEHLDWAYADQGPLTPLIARAMTEISADSLTVLRLPSALAAGLIVLLTGLLARELGGAGARS